MKILAGILISLYLALTLLGLYQYKAHNRAWGMKLVLWMSGLMLVVAIGIRFKSPFLPLFLVDTLSSTKMLIEHGAEVNAKDKRGWKPPDEASGTGMKELLRKHGAKTGAELDAEAKGGNPER